MWQVGLLMRLPRPLARAVKRFSVSLVDVDLLTFSSSISAPSLCSALAIADSQPS
jgi:hypothetical protein